MKFMHIEIKLVYIQTYSTRKILILFLFVPYQAILGMTQRQFGRMLLPSIERKKSWSWYNSFLVWQLTDPISVKKKKSFLTTEVVHSTYGFEKSVKYMYIYIHILMKIQSFCGVTRKICIFLILIFKVTAMRHPKTRLVIKYCI